MKIRKTLKNRFPLKSVHWSIPVYHKIKRHFMPTQHGSPCLVRRKSIFWNFGHFDFLTGWLLKFHNPLKCIDSQVCTWEAGFFKVKKVELSGLGSAAQGKQEKCSLTLAMSPPWNVQTWHVSICTLDSFRNWQIERIVPRYELLSSDFWSSPDGQTNGWTDGQTESDAYEPTVQSAQVGSKKNR